MIRDALTHCRVLLAWCLLMLVATLSLHCEPVPAHGQTARHLPLPLSQWDDVAGVALARMIRHESHSGRDGDAIAWTMARRWFAHACHRGQRFGEYVIETSRFLRRDRFDVHHEAAHALRNDADLRDRLDLWAFGSVPDPCASATFQWRAPGHSAPGRRVSCGSTSNRFFAHPEPGHSRALVAMERGQRVCR